MGWLLDFASDAEGTDRLVGTADYAKLLAGGLFGEAGGLLSELKKRAREASHPDYIQRVLEEMGDFLWYFVRLASALCPELLRDLDNELHTVSESKDSALTLALKLGAVVGAIAGAEDVTEVKKHLRQAWNLLNLLSGSEGIDLASAALANIAKRRSRWPIAPEYVPLFDEGYPVDEQLPRTLTIDFVDKVIGDRVLALMRCNDLNFGDPLTDNYTSPDGYRFHDIFHFAYAVYLGWSPVIRHLLRTKRKSEPRVDEIEDGARARVLEEAISATVFTKARSENYFEGIDRLDYDILKLIERLVKGYEVDSVPLWQWETAILVGFRVFRDLMKNHGGRITIDLLNRDIKYQAPNLSCTGTAVVAR